MKRNLSFSHTLRVCEIRISFHSFLGQGFVADDGHIGPHMPVLAWVVVLPLQAVGAFSKWQACSDIIG
jgi:hypothetical protein